MEILNNTTNIKETKMVGDESYSNVPIDKLSVLKKYHDLLLLGVISESEYQTIKGKILSSK